MSGDGRYNYKLQVLGMLSCMKLLLSLLIGNVSFHILAAYGNICLIQSIIWITVSNDKSYLQPTETGEGAEIQCKKSSSIFLNFDLKFNIKVKTRVNCTASISANSSTVLSCEELF